MLYACLIMRDEDDCLFERKIISQNVEAYDNFKKTAIGCGNIIVDEFIDNDIGELVVLPEDFKY